MARRVVGTWRGDQEVVFGDALARTRQQWVAAMSSRLARRGWDDYRRSDSVLMRTLCAQSMAIGELARVVGVTRQATSKLVEGLESRALVTLSQDPDDARRTLVELTSRGRSYASAIIEVVGRMNEDVTSLVASRDLAATLRVLGSVTSFIDRELHG